MINAPQQGSGKKSGRIVLRVIFILLVILIGFFHLKSSILPQIALTPGIYINELSPFLTDPDALARLAHREHHGAGDLNKAYQLYNRALDNFTLHAPSWLGLAELYYDLNKKDQAIASLKTLDTLKLDRTDLLWSKAKLAQKLSEDQILLSTLIRLADMNKSQRTKIFSLVGKTWGDDPIFILKNFKVHLFPDILLMYIWNNQLDNAKTVWKNIEKNNINNPEVTFTYVNFLQDHNEFDLAVKAWVYTFRRNGNLLFNGDFENPIANSGFDWHASESRSVTLKPVTPEGGMTIVFNGTENVAFRLVQTVPLYPGKHVFSGTFETDNLTSEQLPFWKITGHNCAGLFFEDLMVPPSEHLTEFKIPFTVPEGCKAVELALTRKRANRFDSLISGSITVNSLDITRISPPPILHSEPEEPEAEQDAEKTHEPAVQPLPAPVIEPITETVAEPVEKPMEEPIEEPLIAPVSKPDPVVEPSPEPSPEPVLEPVMETETPSTGEQGKQSPEKIRTTIFINKMEIRP